jgi:hypothetical protein
VHTLLNVWPPTKSENFLRSGYESVWEVLLVAYCAVCVSEGALQTQNGKQRSPVAGKYKFMYARIKQEYRITERNGENWT